MKSISYITGFQKWKEEFTFYTPIKIRFSETDMFGHVNNVSPFIYFEEARIEFLIEAGLFGEETDPEVVPIVADLQCDYLRQLFFNQIIKVHVKVNQIGNTSFDLHYMVVNNKDDLCLTGRGRIVYINPNSGKPAPLTATTKAKLLGN